MSYIDLKIPANWDFIPPGTGYTGTPINTFFMTTNSFAGFNVGVDESHYMVFGADGQSGCKFVVYSGTSHTGTSFTVMENQTTNNPLFNGEKQTDLKYRRYKGVSTTRANSFLCQIGMCGNLIFGYFGGDKFPITDVGFPIRSWAITGTGQHVILQEEGHIEFPCGLYKDQVAIGTINSIDPLIDGISYTRCYENHTGSEWRKISNHSIIPPHNKFWHFLPDGTRKYRVIGSENYDIRPYGIEFDLTI